MTLSVRDGSGNLVELKTSTPTAGEHVGTTTLTDPVTGSGAAVPSATGQDGASLVSAFGVLTSNIPLLTDAAGLPNRQRQAGADLMSLGGIPGTAPLLAHESRKTATTTVSAGQTSATISMSDTTGCIAGGQANFEPDTANYESARIVGVTANTNITVQFPAGGALFTHTSSYTIQTLRGNHAREAPGTTGVTLVSSDGTKPAYRFAVQGITPVATPTDVLRIRGSASMTGRVKRIKISGLATTAGGLVCQLIRRSAAGTIGSATITSITAEQYDSSDAAATLTVGYVQTANYTTPGTSAGVAAVGRLFLNVAATGPTTEVVWEFGRNGAKSQILRGTSEYLWVNFAGAALPAGTVLDFEVELEEDNS